MSTFSIRSHMAMAALVLLVTLGMAAAHAVPARASQTAPMILESFSPSSIVVGGTSTLTVTLVNPDESIDVTGVAWSDTFPAGVTVANPPNLTSSCNDGNYPYIGITPTNLSGGVVSPGDGGIKLSGIYLYGPGSCLVTVSVTGAAIGAKVNTIGDFSSSYIGPVDPASATLNVLTPAAATGALQAEILGSGGAGSVTSRLITYLKSASAYLTLNTPTMRAAACQQFKQFEAAVTSAMRIDPVIGVAGPGWISEAEALRAAIPCVRPN